MSSITFPEDALKELESSNSSTSTMATAPQRAMEHDSNQTSPTSDQLYDDKEKAVVPTSGTNTAEWDGPLDPDNPQNWRTSKKVYHATMPALFGFAVTLGSSIYTPAIPNVMEMFHVSRTVAILGLSLYTLGLGVGPLFTAPLSENHGRKPVYLLSSPIFMLFTLGAGFSKSFAALCVCRFLAGFFGSAALAVGGGTSADMFARQHRAVATNLFVMAPFAGPSLGPIIGGFVAEYKDYRWTQWTLIFTTLFVFFIALPMKETYAPVILRRRAKQLGLPPPPKPDDASLLRRMRTKIGRPFEMLFSEAPVFFFSLYTSFTFAILFAFFAAFPYIFSRPPYSFSTSQVGLTFIAIGVGVLLSCVMNLTIDRIVYQAKHRAASAQNRDADPEHRLYPAMIGAWGITIGLFIFGWCADKGVHWAITLTFGGVPFALGNLSIFTSAALYLVDVYGPGYGASALAANGIARYLLGAVFPLFTVQMYEALGIGWATSLLGFISITMIPIPYLFFKWGPSIRARSRYSMAK